MDDRLEDKAKDLAEARGLLLGPPPKGRGKGVPQLGVPNGPMVLETGWCKGYKLSVGDLPRRIDKVYIGQLCLAFSDVNVTNSQSRSGMSQENITCEDLALALEAFGRLQWSKFDHGDGQMHWASVKWFGHGKCR